MTSDEMLAREAIRDTLARCSLAGDRGQGDAYAECFTGDGIIQTERQENVAFRYEGREAIRAWQKAWKSGKSDMAAPPRTSYVQHCLTTSQVDFTGSDQATVRTYWIVYTDIGPDHAGYYLDELRRVGDEWLISWRRVRPKWLSPDSLFRPADATVDEGN